jgi:peptidoglycan hydrolase-like protein with peptidoglycan-binding domain
MRVLRIGLRGPDVKKWQYFLIGQGLLADRADGKFGEHTNTATIAFQNKYHLTPDGVMGHNTLVQAIKIGFTVLDETVDESKTSPNWPPKPDFPPLIGTTERQKVFGKFAYKVILGGNGDVQILGDWAEKNIVTVNVPQLKGIQGASNSGNIQFHKLATQQVQVMFAAWENAGLLDRILSWGGSFVPRLVRGGTSLSNHAFGTAFDINVSWNQLGIQPALVGNEGSVRELVPIANEHGFFWGGHYANRPDGMHFELAVLT